MVFNLNLTGTKTVVRSSFYEVAYKISTQVKYLKRVLKVVNVKNDPDFLQVEVIHEFKYLD